MTFIAVRCPYCHSDQVVKRGKTRRGTQRYLCHNTACTPQSFLLEYSYQGRLPEVQQQIIDMSLNASGVRDTARVLRISTDTVLRALRKKEAALESVNSALLRTIDPAEIVVDIEQAGEAEVDEMWSFVGKKGNNAGCGTRSTTTQARSWRMSLAAAKTRSFCSSKRYSSLSDSPGFIRIIGARTNAI